MHGFLLVVASCVLPVVELLSGHFQRMLERTGIGGGVIRQCSKSQLKLELLDLLLELALASNKL